MRHTGRNQPYHDSINFHNLSKKQQIDLVVAGKIHLIDLKISKSGIQAETSAGYEGVMGIFCKLEWHLHKSDPSTYPMFRDLVGHSPTCQNPIELDLKQVVNQIRHTDEQRDLQHNNRQHEHDHDRDFDHPNGAHTIYPTGFVFHESRCGSTLVANSLAAMNPTSHRVYSESSPPITAVRVCGYQGEECPEGRAVEILRDVIYVMGRTERAEEKELFFKIQSIGSRYLTVFLEAFPETPWIYVYREPVQIMMSQLAQGESRANCVRQLRDVPQHRVDKLIEDGKELESLSPVDKCALHLSLLCESAVRAIFDAGMIARPVNYENLIQKLVDHIIPDHFGVLMTEEGKNNIIEIGSRYSKGRGGKNREWKEDSHQKEMRASPEIRMAANYFLKEWYDTLEEQSQSEYYGDGANDLPAAS